MTWISLLSKRPRSIHACVAFASGFVPHRLARPNELASPRKWPRAANLFPVDQFTHTLEMTVSREMRLGMMAPAVDADNGGNYAGMTNPTGISGMNPLDPQSVDQSTGHSSSQIHGGALYHHRAGDRRRRWPAA